jgi:WD repeat-containing protein 35
MYTTAHNDCSNPPTLPLHAFFSPQPPPSPELLAGLQKPTRSYKPVTCYQITKKGLGVVKKISRKDKEIVHEVTYMRGSRELLEAEWDGNDYWLQSKSGYRRKSTITDTEDVSYVSSAYVPQCLRYGGRPTLSNAHR